MGIIFFLRGREVGERGVEEGWMGGGVGHGIIKTKDQAGRTKNM